MDKAVPPTKHVDDKPATNFGTSNLALLAFVGILLATTASSVQYSVVAAVILLVLPTVWLWRYEYERKASERADMRTLVQTYALTSTVGMLFVIVLQGLIAVPSAYLLFGSQAEAYLTEATRSEHSPEIESLRNERFRTSRSWQHWVYMALFAFVMAGVIEESLKYSAIMLARRYSRVVHPHENIKVAIAAGLGFATMEGLLFVNAAYQSNESGLVFALTNFERLAIGMPLHVMGSMLIAMNLLAMEKKKMSVSWWRAIRTPATLHGGFDFSLVAISAYNGHVGWVHPRKGITLYVAVGVVLLFQLAMAVTVIRRLRQLGLKLL